MTPDRRSGRPVGTITRGTTNPNRLRRFDRWIIHRAGRALTSAADALAVDLGFGDSPTTTLEFHDRLGALRRGVGQAPIRVVGIEIDPARVRSAQGSLGERADRGREVEFRVGGFEIPVAGSATVIRACNVLRQYPRESVRRSWELMRARLAPGGVLVEGTCDELGRLATWVTIPAVARDGDLGAVVPESLTLSASLAHLCRPSDLAERLPKALIHHNVPGEPIGTFLSELDRAWDRAAPLGVFGPRHRWVAAAAGLRDAGWPVKDGPKRWRLGELTVGWAAVNESG